MAVAPIYLQGVATHQLRAVGLERFSIQRERVGNGWPRPSRFCARGARAPVAQLAVRIGAQMAVRPLNGQRVVSRRELDLLRDDLHRFVLSPWSLVLSPWSLVLSPLFSGRRPQLVTHL